MTDILEVNELEDLKLTMQRELKPHQTPPPVIAKMIEVIESHQALHMRYQTFIGSVRKIGKNEYFKSFKGTKEVTGNGFRSEIQRLAGEDQAASGGRSQPPGGAIGGGRKQGA